MINAHPQEWKVVELRELLTFLTSGSRGWAKFYAPEGRLFLRIQNVRDGKLLLDDIAYVNPPDSAEARRTLVQEGDILISITADLGRTAVVPKGLEAAHINQHLALVRLNQERIFPAYLSTYLSSPGGQLQFAKLNREGVKAGLNFDNIKDLQIPLPPLEEQRRIAAILDKADAVRRKRKEAIALTEELVRSAFLEMFGDPVTNPKGWEMVTVGDIVSDVRDGPHVSPKYSDEGIPILSTRNIRPAQLIMEDVKYVSKETYLDLVKTFRPQRGDVLLTKGGTTGYAKAVDWDWSFAIWVHIAALRPTEKIRPEFLEAALNSPNCYQQSQRYTHGIANKDLGLTRIRKIKLSLPPLDLQDKYCRLRERLLKQLVPQEKSLNESENLFNSLLQRAFRGEL